MNACRRQAIRALEGRKLTLSSDFGEFNLAAAVLSQQYVEGLNGETARRSRVSALAAKAS
jgi:hypothetical protein